jgi:2'-5' RNA ligase
MLLSIPMKRVRVFIAISLPGEVQDALSLTSTQVKEAIGDGVVRWVNPANIHLTLKFLGEIPEADVDVLKNNLEVPVGDHMPFPLFIRKIGVFPNPYRPRVVWAGIQDSIELNQLQRAVESVTQDLGYDSEGRVFSAHLTLGRVSQYANSQEVIKCGRAVTDCKIGGMGSFIVKSVDIFRSDLNTGGSIYTRLYAVPLHQGS